MYCVVRRPEAEAQDQHGGGTARGMLPHAVPQGRDSFIKELRVDSSKSELVNLERGFQVRAFWVRVVALTCRAAMHAYGYCRFAVGGHVVDKALYVRVPENTMQNRYQVVCLLLQATICRPYRTRGSADAMDLPYTNRRPLTELALCLTYVPICTRRA